MKLDFNWEKCWESIKKYLLNKYIITLAIFSCVMLFIGEQSIINRIRRAHQIHTIENQVSDYKQAIEEAKQDLEMLQNKDSLERYARENYYMCAPGEDVYIIEE